MERVHQAKCLFANLSDWVTGVSADIVLDSNLQQIKIPYGDKRERNGVRDNLKKESNGTNI